MAIAYDEISNVAQGTSDLSWTHTPIGTPRGVYISVIQNAEGSIDEVTGVTYGGTSMTEVALSPLLQQEGGEDGVLYGYFLGSSVPSGAQVVNVNVDATGSDKRAIAISVTANADTEIEDTGTVIADDDLAPEVTLNCGTGVECFIAGAIHAGLGNPDNITEGGDYTEILQHDFGDQSCQWTRRTANVAGGDVAVNWNITASQPTGILAVALTETAISGVTTRRLGQYVTFAENPTRDFWGDRQL